MGRGRYRQPLLAGANGDGEALLLEPAACAKGSCCPALAVLLQEQTEKQLGIAAVLGLSGFCRDSTETHLHRGRLQGRAVPARVPACSPALGKEEVCDGCVAAFRSETVPVRRAGTWGSARPRCRVSAWQHGSVGSEGSREHGCGAGLLLRVRGCNVRDGDAPAPLCSCCRAPALPCSRESTNTASPAAPGGSSSPPAGLGRTGTTALPAAPGGTAAQLRAQLRGPDLGHCRSWRAAVTDRCRRWLRALTRRLSCRRELFHACALPTANGGVLRSGDPASKRRRSAHGSHPTSPLSAAVTVGSAQSPWGCL
ncbi:uncharacterized protein LOC121110993 [Gallus gallus]|uniref:uncharacterized protein LOC121110993 n=1 Tax=Gallus gallus TaxID=9031 RepID=UPI001F02D51A|nr:uncharacterized protein LOC121110993 [Gallus gallus]